MKHLLFLIFSLVIGVSYAQNSIVKSISDSTFSIHFTFEDLPFFTKKIGSIDYVDFRTTSKHNLYEKNAPSLPYYAKSILLPRAGNANYKVEFDDVIEYTSIHVLPSLGLQKRRDTSKYYHFGSHYQKNAFYPGILFKPSTPFILRELRGQSVQLYPYQYNPVTKTLRFYKNLRVHVTFDTESGTNELTSPPASHLGEQIFSAQFLNSTKNRNKYKLKAEKGEMLIICPAAYAENLQPFVTWKNQKGIKTHLQTTENIGDSAKFIKNYIQNYYASNPSLLYLLLVGDAEDLPAYTYGNYESDEYWSDSYYGQLAGDDYYSELFVGRFSGSPSEVKTMVDRTLEYEKNPNDGDWMTRAIGIASAQGLGIGDNGESDWQHLRKIKASLLATDYTYVYEFYDGNQGEFDASSNPSNTDIVAAIDSGVGLINYTGHGDTQNFVTSNFTTNDIQKSSNFGKYPFVISVACNNGKFVNTTCLAESWLRATKDNQTTGAISVCGSSILMDWAPPMQTQDEIVRLLGSSDPTIRKTTLGALFNNGQYSMLEKYGKDGNGVVQTWIFFGDPTTVFRNKITKPLDYKIDTIIKNKTTTEITISSSIDSITVGISKNNQFVDQGMFINKKFTYSCPNTTLNENYLVTLTKQNHLIAQFTLNTEGTASVENTMHPSWKIFPNPANSSITIPNTSEFTLKIYMIDGKLINTQQHSGGYNFTMDTSLMSNGNYFFQITSNNTVHTEKVQITH